MSAELELQELEDRLGYRFRDRSLLEAALTHASALPAGAVQVGEQLEFLGDAVLGLAVAHLLLEAFPGEDEGRLSRSRSLLVRASTLAERARELDLGAVLRLGRGEDRSGGRDKESILAAVLEAILGAVFLDGGFGHAEAVVRRLFAGLIENEERLGVHDWKTTLQELTQAELHSVPEYRLVDEQGPAHARQFTVEVWVGGRCLARGSGSSKRDAEQQAAREALRGFAARGS